MPYFTLIYLTVCHCNLLYLNVPYCILTCLVTLRLNLGHYVLQVGTQHYILQVGTQHYVLQVGTKHYVLQVGTQNTEHRTQNTKHRTQNTEHNGANMFNVLSMKFSERRNYEKISFHKVCCHLLQNSSLSNPKNYTTASYQFVCPFDAVKVASSTQLIHHTHFYTEKDAEEPKRTFEPHRCYESRLNVFTAEQCFVPIRNCQFGQRHCVEVIYKVVQI